ncbi:hypothetical protein GKQ23_13095 [Erwinia sp. E602]|uniref:lipoprotein n=1 Tax=Erwinia sp. E602 TaxID=2675378 RepID=UPI001BAE0462|nr:lipoprotein [Erwinia sp. E602]QUG75870.1 hypothetical protein GKQ23_13095 [Erwinia sp. E602]
MKKLLLTLLLLFTLSGCTTHSYMDTAYIGTVEGKVLVLKKVDFIRNGQVMYRPQFNTDCPYGGQYIGDYTSTNCYIRESRISNLTPYREHKQAVPERNVRTSLGYVEELPEVPGEY